MPKFLLRIAQFEGAASITDGRLEVVARRGYAIRQDGGLRGIPSITCLACGMTSVNVHDVEQRYCGHCHVFHDEPYQ